MNKHTGMQMQEKHVATDHLSVSLKTCFYNAHNTQNRYRLSSSCPICCCETTLHWEWVHLGLCTLWNETFTRAVPITWWWHTLVMLGTIIWLYCIRQTTQHKTQQQQKRTSFSKFNSLCAYHHHNRHCHHHRVSLCEVLINSKYVHNYVPASRCRSSLVCGRYAADTGRCKLGDHHAITIRLSFIPLEERLRNTAKDLAWLTAWLTQKRNRKESTLNLS